MSYSYASRNPLAATNPLRSMVWNKPAHQVLGWTPRQVAEFTIARDRNNLAAIEVALASACRQLGFANQAFPYKRAAAKAAAFRAINSARARLRATRESLAAAELELLAFATAA